MSEWFHVHEWHILHWLIYWTGGGVWGEEKQEGLFNKWRVFDIEYWNGRGNVAFRWSREKISLCRVGIIVFFEDCCHFIESRCCIASDCRDPGSFRESPFGSCWGDGWWREQRQSWVTGCGGADRRLNFTFVRWTGGGIWSLRLHCFEHLAQFWSCCQLSANPCENTEVECLFLSVVIVKNCGLMLLQELLVPLFESTFSSKSKSELLDFSCSCWCPFSTGECPSTKATYHSPYK